MNVTNSSTCGFLLKNSSFDAEVWSRGTEREEEVIFIDKVMKRAKVEYNYFVLHDENLWKPQQLEKNLANKYSAKYGHWCRDCGYIDSATAEFILARLRTIDE